MAAFNAFFHLVRSCTMFGSMFLKQKSSITDSFHVLCGLPLPEQPPTSARQPTTSARTTNYLCPDNQLPLPVQPTTNARTTNFFNLGGMIYLSICSYHLRRFILSLDSKSRRRNRESILYRPTCSSILTQHIQRNIVRSFFSRRLIFSLRRAQQSLALSKTPLTQLLNNTPMPC